MIECEDSIEEHITIDGVTARKWHYCQKPKGHDKMRHPLSVHACGCGNRWEKGSR